MGDPSVRKAYNVFYGKPRPTEESMIAELEEIVEYWTARGDAPFEGGEVDQARGYLASLHNARRWTGSADGDSPAFAASTTHDAAFERVLPQALHCVARNLTRLHEGPVTRPERHLEEALEAWFKENAEAVQLNAVSRQVSMRHARWWPGVGGVDLELRSHQRTWIELKWTELWKCAWDLPKLGLALANSLCDSAYLMAAAPKSAWNSRIDGAEYFGPGSWDVHDELGKYRPAWQYWSKAVKTRPLRLPAVIVTRPVSRPRSMRMAGTDWELRASRLTVPTDEFIDVDEDRVPHRR